MRQDLTRRAENVISIPIQSVSTREKENDEEEVDFSEKESLGACPKCKANVYGHGMHYVCQKSKGPDKSCDFKTGKIILQREIEPSQIRKLLENGKTELINKFISNRTGRAFNAFLAIKDGGVSFEFEPRKTKKKSSKKSDEPAKKISFEEAKKCRKEQIA